MEQINVIKLVTVFCCSFILVVSNGVYATNCPKPVQPISEGQTANCSGYLFSPEAESKAYKAVELSDLYKKENEILEKRLELYVRQSDVLAKQVARTENTESLYRLGYFALGVIITGVIASNVNR